ncbi:MAG: class I SAM-dependent methyltransferase [Bacteroidota bacterium]|nr:class I SAM-dependent methyltransferase [Bacteroidota bacterium]MDP4248730.1 class I SAM-dependent methyltransferase [Bacteroidota bacterium]
MTLPDSSILTNIHFPGNENPGNSLFEKKYISIRCMENRLYSDDEVASLPDISRQHSHFSEWIIRKRSSQRLIRYLTARKRRLNILEVGCGNGWLAHGLSEIPGAEVTGLDINFTELQQAARVFNEHEHLRFIYGDITSGILHDRLFDVIVFAASIQYFHSLTDSFCKCLKLLKRDGEIHLIDSPLYLSGEIEAAKQRTFSYYDSLGYPEMSEYYFHHDIRELQVFNHKIMQNPNSVFNRFLGSRDCFHWIRVKK